MNQNNRPLIFSAPMVRALLAGAKTMTRRMGNRYAKWKKGDRIWVRETWWTYPHGVTEKDMRDGADSWPFVNDILIAYDADGDGEQWRSLGLKKKSPIFMPRWASRITLELTSNAYQQPLHEITEDDARREGFSSIDSDSWKVSAAAQFRKAWLMLHGGTAWTANTLVWVIGFRVMEATP